MKRAIEDPMRTVNRLNKKLHRQLELDAVKILTAGPIGDFPSLPVPRASWWVRATWATRRTVGAWFRRVAEALDPGGGESWD